MRLALLVAAAAFAGCASAATSPSGLRGLVLRGPVQPVCRVGVPCDAPAAGYVLVFSRSGTVVARTETGADGRYRIALRPGRYAVRTSRTGFERTVRPSAVTVPAGRWARVTFRIDTGIR
jgi:hypothetical protein